MGDHTLASRLHAAGRRCLFSASHAHLPSLLLSTFQLVATQSVRKGRGASKRPARISYRSGPMPPTTLGSVLSIGAILRTVRAKARRTTPKQLFF